MEKYMEWTFIKDDKAGTLVWECHTYLFGDDNGEWVAETVAMDRTELNYFDVDRVSDILVLNIDSFRSFLREKCDDVIRISDLIMCDENGEILDVWCKFTPSELLGALMWCD